MKIFRDIRDFVFIASVVDKLFNGDELSTMLLLLVTGDKLLQVLLSKVIKSCPEFSSIP
jgi:hypothetical protein